MNAIQMFYAVTFYTNRTYSERYFNIEINKAVNDAIMKKIDSITDTAKQNELNGIDRIQKFRDELYTLLKKSATGVTAVGTINDTVTEEHILFPTDYQTFAALTLTIDGYTKGSRPTTYGERNDMIDCSFRRPNNKKTYYLEDATGLLVYRGIGGTVTTVKLDYIKQPAEFTMGLDSQLIDAGAGVLTNTTSYIATQDSVHNGITYAEGTQFVSANTNLTSGQVILTANTTPCELPEKCHDEIAKMAAEILLGVNKDYEASAFSQKETS